MRSHHCDTEDMRSHYFDTEDMRSHYWYISMEVWVMYKYGSMGDV